MKFENKIILLISPERWGDNFVSKHHYANYLSKKNTVYFLNPPNGNNFLKKGGMEIQTTPISASLISVEYKNLCPRLNNLPKVLRNKIYLKQAAEIQKFLGINNFDVVWSFDPARFYNQKNWTSTKSIYHTVDVHYNKCFEKEMCYSSDLVLLSSEILRKNLSEYSHQIHTIGHGADIDTFQNINELIDLPGENLLKAGLIGNFNRNVDYELIEKIAQENVTIDFIFIGPYKANNLGNDTKNVEFTIDLLQKQPNIFFIGSVNSALLGQYVSQFDINLVLYKESKQDIIINPHKMMTYFYSGKITITSPFYEYKEAPKELLIMAKSNHEIPRLIKETAKKIEHWNNDSNKLLRKKFAIKNSYWQKLIQIESLLN